MPTGGPYLSLHQKTKTECMPEKLRCRTTEKDSAKGVATQKEPSGSILHNRRLKDGWDHGSKGKNVSIEQNSWADGDWGKLECRVLSLEDNPGSLNQVSAIFENSQSTLYFCRGKEELQLLCNKLILGKPNLTRWPRLIRNPVLHCRLLNFWISSQEFIEEGKLGKFLTVSEFCFLSEMQSL